MNLIEFNLINFHVKVFPPTSCSSKIGLYFSKDSFLRMSASSSVDENKIILGIYLIFLEYINDL